MKVECSNCGKRVPFAGKVCPFCHANKHDDKVAYVIMLGCAMAGAVIGGLVGSFLATFIGGVTGAMIGAAIAGFVNARRQGNNRPQIPDLGP